MKEAVSLCYRRKGTEGQGAHDPAPPHPAVPRLGTGSGRVDVKQISHSKPHFLVLYSASPCLSQPLTGRDFFIQQS